MWTEAVSSEPSEMKEKKKSYKSESETGGNGGFLPAFSEVVFDIRLIKEKKIRTDRGRSKREKAGKRHSPPLSLEESRKFCVRMQNCDRWWPISGCDRMEGY